ncbi:hypothetical protein GCM10022403_062590 [Streptomyces coacervatus]|uniref:DUF11 domain-containing protein n=2 Tax=Streptomyces coacervatus TaxID=647381 RepID=A0ABP7IK43_9ACTN|nr:hypothetical protein [Streptomyces coacervatus]MDF2273024.1 hypothetical protein [Streptomyces coacervatus]
MRVLAVGAAALGVVVTAAPPSGADGAPVAGLSYHGVVSMTGGQVDLRLTPRNHGPSAVPEATVRLSWSVAPENGQLLPAGCVRSGPRVMLCRVGALAAGAVGEQIEVRLRLRGAPSEVLVEIGTEWSAGVVDGSRKAGRERVLVLDTGDEYYF